MDLTDHQRLAYVAARASFLGQPALLLARLVRMQADLNALQDHAREKAKPLHQGPDAGHPKAATRKPFRAGRP